jgi:hypothetical protein
MPIESTTTIAGLTSNWPLSNDTFGGTDDHLRVIKSVLKTTFPGSGGQGFSIPITATEAEINRLVGVTSGVQAQINLKAPLASPTFTGTPDAPTAAQGTSTTQLATTAFVTTGLNLKSDIASPTFTGVPAVPTPAVGINTTQIINAAWAKTGIGAAFSTNGYIKLASWMAAGNSLIIQWVKVSGVSGSTSGTVTFPIPFPNAVFAVNFCEKATAGTGGISDAIGYNVVSLSNVTYSKPSNRDEFYCIAIGF